MFAKIRQNFWKSTSREKYFENSKFGVNLPINFGKKFCHLSFSNKFPKIYQEILDTKN